MDKWNISFAPDYGYYIWKNADYLHRDGTISNTCGERNFFETKEEAQSIIKKYGKEISIL